MQKLRIFLQGDGTPVNKGKTLHTNKTTLNATEVPFEQVIFKELDTGEIVLDVENSKLINNESNWSNYTEYLLSSSEEMGRTEDSLPPLQVSIPVISNGVADAQVSFRYIKYETSPIVAETTPVTTDWVNPNPVSPEDVTYTEIQKRDITQTEVLLDSASKGLNIEVETPMGIKLLAPPTISGLLSNYDIGELPGQEVQALGLKENATLEDVIIEVQKYLSAYKENTYAESFVKFLNQSLEGNVPTPIDPASIKTTEEAVITEPDTQQLQVDKATEVPEFTEQGQVIPDFGDIISAIEGSVEVIDTEEMTPEQQAIERQRKLDSLNLDSLDAENPDGVAESLVTDLRYDPKSNKKSREITKNTTETNMKLMFPRMKIDYIEGFMKGKNGVVQGKVTEYGRIMVSKMSQPGTEYHEAWHQVSLYMLPESEAQELFDEVRSQSGEVINFKGVRKKFSELTDKEADEWLADEFRNVVLSNGAYQVGSNKVKNWFEEMLAFIVNFVSFGLLDYDYFNPSSGIFGEQGGPANYTSEAYKIAKFFDKVREGQFAKTRQNPKAIGGTAESLTLGSTVKFDMDVISTLDKYLADTIFSDVKEGGLHLADLGNLGNKGVNKIFEQQLKQSYLTSISRMLQDLQNLSINPDLAPEMQQAATRHFDTLMAKMGTLVKMHRDHLSEIGLNFEVQYEDLAEDETARIDKNSASNMFNAMEFSTRDSASSIMKFLISTLPGDTRNDSLLQGSVEFAQTINFLQDKLAGTQSLDAQVAILKTYMNTQPWIKPLLQRIGVLNSMSLDGKTIKDVIVQGAFFNQFAKQKNDFLTHLMDFDGNIYSTDTNKTRLNELIADPWKNNILTNPSGLAKLQNGKIVIDPTKKFTIAPGVLASIKDLHTKNELRKLIKGKGAIQFLKQLGIVFTNPSRLLSREANLSDEKSNIDILNESTSWIITELNKPNLEGEIQADIFNSDNLDTRGRLGKLMQLEAIDNNTAIELQHFTPDGKVVYGITLNTYLSTVVNSNKNGKVSKYLDPTTNLYTRNSRIVQSIQKGANIRLFVQQGAAIAGIGDKGITTERLVPSDQIAGIVNDTLDGKARFLRAADQSVEYVIGMPGGRISLSRSADIFKGYLLDELNVAQSPKGKEFSTFRNAEGLRFFKNIVGDIVNEKMHAELDLIVQGRGIGTPAVDEFVSTYWTKTIQPTLQKYFDKKAVENLNLWVTNKIVTRNYNGQFEINGIDKPTAAKIIGETSPTYSRSQILKLAKVFSINYMSNNIEQFKVFLGDPAFYKGLFKRTKMSTGTKELSRTDANLDAWLNTPENMRSDKRIADGTEEVVVFNDPIVVSDYLQLYTQILGDNAATYGEIMEADAAAFATLDAYREFSIRTQDWSPVQEQLYWQIQTGTKATLTKDEYASFPIKKPQYMGPQVTSDGQFAPFGMKISLAPILPHMLKDPNTGQPTQFSKLSNDLKTKRVGIALFPSGAKFGHRVDSQTGRGTDFYKADGTISDINPTNITTIDYKFFGKQQMMSPKAKTYTTTGTQKRTLMKSDLFESGIPTDYLSNYSNEDRRMMWNNLSEVQKEDISPVYKLIKEYDLLYNGLTVAAKNNLLKRFGITKGKNGYQLIDKNYTEFGRTIKNELTKRNMPRALKSGVEWILDESPEKLFDMLTTKNRLESLLFSLVNNNIVSQKMKGDMYVQGTSTGMEIETRAVKQVGSKVLLTSGSATNRLKFYEVGDTGKTLGMEVYLPNYFKEFLGENLIIRSDGVYNEAGKKVADSSLLDVIGFRIPTDGLHSIEFIKIKGFLSKEGGSQVIVPSELPAKTGSDFDIDKLSIYLPSYVRKGGVLTKRQMIQADTTTNEGLKQYYNAQYGPTLNYFKELDRDLAEARDKSEVPYDTDIDKLLTSIFGEDSLDYTAEELDVLSNRFKSLENSSQDLKMKFAEQQYENIKKRVAAIPTFTEWAAENKGKRIVELNHFGAIQNRIMDISKEILEHPRSRYSLLNPISTVKLGYDGLAGDLRALKGVSRNPDNINYDEMITLKNVSEVMETFLTGKENVGIEALNVTHHIKAQQAGLHVRANQIIEQFGVKHKIGIFLKGFEHTTLPDVESIISLSNIRSLDNELISDSLSQMVNAFIDVSNDPFIFELNFNPRTSNAWNFLIRAGVPTTQIAYLMNQPIIEELITNFKTNDSKFLKAQKKNIGVSDILENLREKISNLIVDDIAVGPKSFDTEYLKGTIGMKYSEMSQEQLKDQLQILQDYRMYDAIGGELNNVIQASSQDTKGINSRAHAKVMERKYMDVVTKDIFGNFDNLFENKLMHEFRNTHFDTSKMFNSFFFTEKQNVKSDLGLGIIEDIFTNPDMMKGVKASEKAIQKAENDAIMYLLSDIKLDDSILGDKIKKFFTGENSLPKQLNKIKQEGSDNILINKLIPMIATRQEGTLMDTDNIKLLSKILNTYDQNLLLDSWWELYGNPFSQQLALDLLDFSLLQSGLNNSPISFIQYLPSDIYAKRASKVFKQFEQAIANDKYSKGDFLEKFFKNNWNDPNIVPRVFGKIRNGRPNIVVGDPVGEYPYVSLYATQDGFTKEEEEWYMTTGKAKPSKLKLFQRSGIVSTTTKKGVFKRWRYIEVNRLGNGIQLREYTNKDEQSILPSNNTTTTSSGLSAIAPTIAPIQEVAKNVDTAAPNQQLGLFDAQERYEEHVQSENKCKK